MNIGEIEENVPVPRTRANAKYPWAEMGIRDSVLITVEKGEPLEATRKKVSSSVYQFGSFTGKKFRTRLMRKEKGVRIWRVE